MHYVHIASNEKREGEKNELIKHQKSYVLSIYLFLFVNTVIFYVNYLPVDLWVIVMESTKQLITKFYIS